MIKASIIFKEDAGIIGFNKALTGGLYPFIPSEIFKIALAVAIIPTIWKQINK